MDSKEVMIKTDSVEICAESFGDQENPAILLIMGAAASMVWWDEEFCQRLAGRGRFVIRYDNRDTGCSTSYEPGKPEYSVDDMVDDAIRVLDYYKIKKADFVGMSLGGMIAQLAALRTPERVSSLTLISSSVWDIKDDLPQIDKRILDYHSSVATAVNWSDEQSVIKYMAEGWRLLNGSKHPFDEAQAYRLAEKELKRARNLLSMFNHSLLKGGEAFYGRGKEIKAPTLIIHGTEDPVLPFQHAEALEKSIPGAKLLTLEGVGHEIPYTEWDRIIDAIIAHTSKKI
jgi:pimeloyl-ACP methyl ester carboxylesterase